MQSTTGVQTSHKQNLLPIFYTVDTCCRSRTMNFSVNCPAHLYRKQLLPQCRCSNKQYYAARYSLSHVCLLWEIVGKCTPAIQSAEWVVYESVNKFRENGVSPHVINKAACVTQYFRFSPPKSIVNKELVEINKVPIYLKSFSQRTWLCIFHFSVQYNSTS